MKIYIAGKMTGLKNYNFYKFFEAERKIKENMKFEVVNPAYESLKLCHEKNANLEDLSYDDYFNNSMAELKKCNAIYMMAGWSDSSGAKRELEFAKQNNFTIFYENAKEQNMVGGNK